MRCIIGFTAWVLGVSASVAVAATTADFPDRFTGNGTTLVKNGEGMRTATIFNVKVYQAALYLPEKTDDATKVLASKEPKRLEMKFLRDVAVADMRKAWDENFRENCTQDCEKGLVELEKIKGWMQDAKSGDVLALDFRADGVKFSVNGEKRGETTEKPAEGKFSGQLLAIWLGKHPPNGALKDGLLGH